METNKITIINYEAYMVDYWDGQLEPSLQEALMLFLAEHPEIKNEFLDAGQFTLPTDDLFFEAKDSLIKKEVNTSNIDEFLVAELEHDLLPHEQNELSLFIASNPQFKRDRALYALTKLTPDKNFVYPDKRSLMKGVVRPIWIRYSSVAAAACVFFAIGIWWFNRQFTGQMALSTKPFYLSESIYKQNSFASQTNTKHPNQQTETGSIRNPNTTQKLIVKEAVAVTKPTKAVVIPIQIKDAMTENFYSYGQNRKADDFLSGLVNSYLPEETTVIAYNSEETEPHPAIDPVTKPNTSEVVSTFASKNLSRMIKDSALANELKNQKYSLKTKVASALAWATGKASGGKVKAIVIPNFDGSLAALSFTNGKYNYTKRF